VEETLVTKSLAEALNPSLPVTLSLGGPPEWVLQYTPKAHGVSMETLFRSVKGSKNTMLVVKDAEGHIFGGFATEPWAPHHSFYGSGEAFVFSSAAVVDGGEAQAEVFPWTAANDLIQFADHDVIIMGGRNGHHALLLEKDLLKGYSWPTKTFGNPTLATSNEFVVKDIEIWSVQAAA
jgi:hypothetical protein